MDKAARELSPPRHLKLRRGDKPFWDAVIAERAKSEWSEADLAVAAQLARAMADAERLAAMAVDKNGGHVSDRIVMVTIASADKLARRVVTLRRSLGIDSRSKHGEQRDVDKRRAIAREIESGHNPLAADGDDLLARPMTVN